MAIMDGQTDRQTDRQTLLMIGRNSSLTTSVNTGQNAERQVRCLHVTENRRQSLRPTGRYSGGEPEDGSHGVCVSHGSRSRGRQEVGER